MRDLIKVNDEVYYAPGGVSLVDQEKINFLKEQALSNPRHRCRLCVHPDPSAPFHNMIIAMSRGAYVRPHKHLDKDESLHLIEGDSVLVIFKDDGRIQESIRLGEAGSGQCFFYRMPAGVFHTQLITSDWLVFHESTSGPFDPEAMIEAPWAPDDDADALNAYQEMLRNAVPGFDEKNGSDRS